MPNKTYNKYNANKEDFWNKAEANQDDLQDFVNVMNDEDFLTGFEDAESNEYSNSLYEKFTAYGKEFAASFKEDLESGPSLSDQSVESIEKFIETGFLLYCATENILPDQKEKESVYADIIRDITPYKNFLLGAVSNPTELLFYFTDPFRSFKGLYNDVKLGLTNKLNNMQTEQELKEWQKEDARLREEEEKSRQEELERKENEKRLAREKEERELKEKKEKEARIAAENERIAKEKAEALKIKAEKEFAEKSKDNLQFRFNEIRHQFNEKMRKNLDGDDDSGLIENRSQNAKKFDALAESYVDKHFGEGLTKQDAVDETIKFVHDRDIRHNPGKEVLYRNFEGARYDFIKGNPDVQVKAARDMLFFYRALSLYKTYPNANYQVPGDDFCTDDFIKANLANPAAKEGFLLDKDTLLERVNKMYEAEFTEEIGKLEEKLKKENVLASNADYQKQWDGKSFDDAYAYLNNMYSASVVGAEYGHRTSSIALDMKATHASQLVAADRDKCLDLTVDYLLQLRLRERIYQNPQATNEELSVDDDQSKEALREALDKYAGDAWSKKLKGLLDIQTNGSNQLEYAKNAAAPIFKAAGLTMDSPELPPEKQGNYSAFEKDILAKGEEYTRYALTQGADITKRAAILDLDDSEIINKIEEKEKNLVDFCTELMFETDPDKVCDLAAKAIIKDREMYRMGMDGGVYDDERIEFGNKEDLEKLSRSLKNEYKNRIWKLKQKFEKPYEITAFTKQLTADLKLSDFALTEDAFETAKQAAEEEKKRAAHPEENEQENPKEDEVVEETEEEIKLRKDNELKEKLVSTLAEEKNKEANTLKGNALTLSNEKFGHLENAIKANSVEEMVDSMAKAYVIEYNAQLKPEEFMYKRMGETPEKEVESFRNIINSSFSKETLSSDEFRKKLTSTSSGDIKKLFEAYKQESYQVQENKFKDALKAAGIDPEDKYDMMRLEIMDNKKVVPNMDGDTYKLVAVMDSIKKSKTYPALGISASGQQIGFPSENMTLISLMENKAHGYSGLYDYAKNALISGMKNNRLTVAPTDGNPENTRFITMGKNGPMLSATVKELKENPNAFAENGFNTAKDLKNALELHDNKVEIAKKLPEITKLYTQKFFEKAADYKPERMLNDLGPAWVTSNFVSNLQKMHKMKAEGSLNPQTMAENFGKSSRELAQTMVNDFLGIEDPLVEAVKTNNQASPEEVNMARFIVRELGLKNEADFTVAIENGYITFDNRDEGRGLFDASKGSATIVREMCQKIKRGENVIMSKPDGSSLKEYKLNISGTDGNVTDKKIEAAPDTLENDSKRRYMENALKAVSNALNATGISKGDSNEFKFFKATLQSFSNTTLPKEPGAMKMCLNAVKKDAFQYFFAKLDQSQNSRRSERFMQAAKLIEVIDAFNEGRQPSLVNMEKTIIASKAIKTQCMTALKSRNPQLILQARNITKDINSFYTVVKAVKSSQEFRNKFDNKTAEELHKISTKKADKLGKEVQNEGLQVR